MSNKSILVIPPLTNSPRDVPNRSSGVEAPSSLTEIKDWVLGVEGSKRFGFVDELSTPESLEIRLRSRVGSEIIRESWKSVEFLRVGRALIRSSASCRYPGSLGTTGALGT